MPFMNITGPELAFALENVEATHLQRQVETYRQLTARDQARTIVVNGGIAAFTETVFGRKLNHVTGFGMGSAVSADCMDMIEQAYAAMDLDVEIDMCPHAHPTVLPTLADRGYKALAFSNTYIRQLTDSDTDVARSSAVEVVGERTQVEDLFVSHSIAGFSVQAVPRPTILLETLARIAVTRADTFLFAANLDGEIAGTAGMSIVESPVGRIAHLYIASTLPTYRGRGVQLALLRARLMAATHARCVLASVTARPSNASARNAERIGFNLAYTKATFVKRRRDIAMK